MHKRFFLLMALLLIFSFSFSKDEDPQIEGKKKVDVLYDKVWDFIELKPNLDSAFFYANLQKDLAIKENYELGLIKAYYALGYINYLKKEQEDAVQNYFAGLKLTIGTNDTVYLKRRMLILRNLAVVYEETGNIDEAIDYAKEALKIAKAIHRADNIAWLSFNLGVIYERKEDFKNALVWYEKANQSLKDFPNQYLLTRIHNCLGNVYNKTQRYNKAKEHYLMALKISANDEIHKRERIWYLNNLGENHFKRGLIVPAIEYYNQALSLSQYLKDTTKSQYIYNNIGDVYLKEKNYSKAISYYKKSLEAGRNKLNVDHQISRSYKKLAMAFEQLGDYKKALFYKSLSMEQLVLTADTKDKIIGEHIQFTKFEHQNLEHENQTKEARLQQVQEQNYWIKALIGLLVFSLIYASYRAIKYYRFIRLAKEWINSL